MASGIGQDERGAAGVGVEVGARVARPPGPKLQPCGRGARVGVTATLGLLASFVVSGASGCFDPKVQTGTLHCGVLPGKQCPDGFTCVNGLCDDGAGGKGGHGGAGGAGGTCAHPIVPLCQTAAGVPAPCDPVCQTGCGCGMRCNITATGPACVPAGGTKGAGQICNPAADDCMPGHTCRQEPCGSHLGRCYLLCRDNNVCGSGNVCGTLVNLPGAGGSSGFRGCNIGVQSPACDPFARTGCPDPALVCFATTQGGKCDCPGVPERQLNEACNFFNDCAAGLTCLGQAGEAATCHTLCQSPTDCLGGAACVPSGASGFCP